MPIAALQPELDFHLGHSRPWITVGEIARALDVSESHVCNLFDNAAIDFVIDIKAPDAARPYYRILREAWENFQTRRAYQFHPGPAPHPDYAAALDSHLRRMPSAMGSATVAGFLRVCENHVLSLAGHFTDAGAGGQTYFRAGRNQLLNFIQTRRIQ